MFFAITDYSDAIEFVSTAIGEDEKLTTAVVWKRRCDVFRDWIGVKLFIYDDPHVDLLLTHHREKHRVEAFLQPRFTDGLLLANGEEFREWFTLLRIDCNWRCEE